MPPLEDPVAEPQADPRRSESRAYWRSVDRLLDSPAVQAELGRSPEPPTPEFPDGADLPPDAVSRRTMMSLMGASFALAGLQGCRRPVEHIVPYVESPETSIPGVPRHYATTLPLGTDAYGVVVESHDGRPTKIEGNPDHPSSQGGADVWMQAAILDLYDPDRSRDVWRRASGETTATGGEGGAARHERSSWGAFETSWQELAGNLGDGTGLAVLSEGYSSPTLARLRTAFEGRFPGARWVVAEPAGDANVFAGIRLATGGAHRPLVHLERAKVVLALDADLLHTESEHLRHARGFARRRRVGDGEPAGGMGRLYAVESTLTVTGAAADHRLRLKSGEIPGFVAALAAELGVAAPVGSAAGHEARLRVLAADLRAAGAEALVVAGRRQPPAVHALALAINQALGAVGTTLTLHPLADAGWGGPEALAELAASIAAGEVRHLVVLGGNPVYNAPADVDFAAAMAQLESSVHLSVGFDETSHLAEWHLPGTHFLEAWGDARAADGTLSVVQPLIAPLFDGRSAVELVHLLTADAHQPGYELVRETWRGIVADDAAWATVLHDGLLADGLLTPAAGSTPPAAAVEVRDLAALEVPAAPAGIELTFHLSETAWDGRFANLSWLQELPDAITKITWDNAALISPATARRFGLEIHQKERKVWFETLALTYRGVELDVPVFVLPGQADDSVAVHLGFGRRAVGRVGDGVGFSAYALRHSDAPWFDGGLELGVGARQHDLTQTQEHWSMNGRPLVLEADLETYREHPDFVHEEIHTPAVSQLFAHQDYSQGYQWGMAIDLNACTGCNACLIACQSENNVPVVGKAQISRGREMHWLRLDRYFGGPDAATALDDPQVVFQPIPCMHCENAPCEQVCPVAATTHDSEGLNAMVYNRCIGTRYCSNNCPYKVRRFNFFNYTKDTPELLKIAHNPDVTVRSRGVMEKCSYCLQRISEAKIDAKKTGRRLADGDVQTACQQTCPSAAIAFGDINDPDSEVARWKADERNYTLLDELHNLPRTSYLAKIRNPNPAWEEA